MDNEQIVNSAMSQDELNLLKSINHVVCLKKAGSDQATVEFAIRLTLRCSREDARNFATEVPCEILVTNNEQKVAEITKELNAAKCVVEVKFRNGKGEEFKTKAEALSRLATETEKRRLADGILLNQQGELLIGQGDDMKAAHCFIESAEKGYVEGQANAGFCHYYGQGVSQDYKKAAEYFNKAAIQGEPNAQYMLCKCYYDGKGVARDSKKAAEWATKSAKQGCHEAEYLLGWCKWSGTGTPKNPTEAISLWQKSAVASNSEAQWALGHVYYYGKSIKSDKEKAKILLEDALEGGCVNAACELGFYYLEASVPDYNQTIHYIQLALEQGVTPFVVTEHSKTADQATAELKAALNKAKNLLKWQSFPDFGAMEQNPAISVPELMFPINFMPSKENYGDFNIVWQKPENNKKNFVINYSPANEAKAVDIMNQLVMSIMLSLPIKKVNLNIINLGWSSNAGFLTSQFSKNNLIGFNCNDASTVSKLIEHITDDMRHDMEHYGPKSQEQHNEEIGQIAGAYELVVMLSSADDGQIRSSLNPVFNNGAKFGDYFIVLNDVSKNTNSSDESWLSNKDVYYEINVDNLPQESYEFTTQLVRNGEWVTRVMTYVNEAVKTANTHKFDWDAAVKAPYANASEGIVAPIGYDAEGKTVNVMFDDRHVHAFMIGQTGSGKTRFLHNVILSMITKYSPEDLELYLIDFKGTEFPCYRNLPHSRVVLVNDADAEVIYSVIRDLKQQMTDREKLFRETSSSNIQAYNSQAAKRIPHVLLVIDECQSLFTNDGDVQNKKKIYEIIATIAQKGRSFGIHMLFATQSLSNTPRLSDDVLRQISEHYILTCDTNDAATLVPDVEARTTEKEVADMLKNQTTVKGQCYYQGNGDNTRFIFNYVSDGEMQDGLIEAATAKGKDCPNNPVVYFSGEARYEVTDQVVGCLDGGRRRDLIVSPGIQTSLEQTPISISLKKDYSQNILFTGVNEDGFLSRTSFAAFYATMQYCRANGLNYKFLVIDCLDDSSMPYYDFLYDLSDNGYCEILEGAKKGQALLQLCNDISNGTAQPTVLFIHGQERFGELRADRTINGGAQPAAHSENKATSWDDFQSQIGNAPSDDDTPSFLAPPPAAYNPQESLNPFGTSAPAGPVTFKTAIETILDQGPENGIHTMLQIDRVERLLFDDSVYSKQIYNRFNHVVALKLDTASCSKLDIDGANLEDLPCEENRLRAIYYNNVSIKSTLFTPFMMPEIKA